MNSNRFVVVWLAVLAFCVPVLAPAARQGRLVGKVIDPQGTAVDNVVVVATSTSVPGYRETDTTDEKGSFTIDFPQLGVVYTLKFERAGYAPLAADLTWDLFGTAHKEYTMYPQGMVEMGTEQVASSSPEAIDAYNAGVEAFKAKDYATSETQFQAAVGHDPNLRQAWEALSLVEFELGKYKDSAEAAERAMALGQVSETTLRTRWEAYRKLGDDEKAAAALADLEKAGKLVEEAKKVYNDGVVLLKEGKDQEALDKFQQATELDPSLEAALNAVATTAMKLGHAEQAEKAAAKMLSKNPADEEALKIRYNAALAIGDPETLVSALVGLAPVNPKVAENGLLKLAFDAYDANDMAKAEDRFSKVITLFPDSGVAYYYIAIAEVNLGRNEQAKDHLKHFLTLSPGDKEAASAREMLEYLEKQ